MGNKFVSQSNCEHPKNKSSRKKRQHNNQPHHSTSQRNQNHTLSLKSHRISPTPNTKKQTDPYMTHNTKEVVIKFIKKKKTAIKRNYTIN